jgi:hypothetical protein
MRTLLKRWMLWMALSGLLAGCADMGRGTGLVPGASSSAEVMAIYGRPVRVWPEADGGRTLEYSSQPFGRHCYMVKLGADDKLVSVTDTLSYHIRFGIEPGMSQAQVSRLLGTERSRVFYRFSGEDVWDWNVEPDQGGYLLRFNVHFKNGQVVRLSQSAVYPGKFPFEDR